MYGQLSEPVMILLTHVCHLLPVISQGSQPCLGYVNVLHTCEAVDCLVAAWSLAKELKILAATKQLYEWSCPSYRHTHLSSGVIDTDRGNVHAKGQGHRGQIKFCPNLGKSGP